MALTCSLCGQQIPAGTPFCSICGTPAPAAGSDATATAASPTIARAPRSGGVRGLLMALGSVGCLGAIVVGLVILGIVIYTSGRSSPDGGASSAPHDGPVYNEPLEPLLPQELGGYQLQKVQPVDNDTKMMLGAADALRGRYSSGMSLLVLNYISADRAGGSVGQLRATLFPDAEGWSVVEQGAARVGHRVAALHSESGRLAAIWNHGSLVLIFGGDAAQLPAFEKSAPELLTKGSGQQ